MSAGHIGRAALAFATVLIGVVGSVCLGVVTASQEANRYNFRFVRHARDAPAVSYYNYIVVGGGTAGCPLAATLSEHSRVLLLERGGLPYGNRNVSSEYHFADALADTSPLSPAQRFVSEDGVVNARARVLGGGSCLNAGFYTRASAGYVRAAGWDHRLVNASYRWVERALVFRPGVPRWQCALREGLLEAGVTPDNGYTLEHVPGTKIGGTIFDRRGRRHTAADFLRRAHPRRLTVFLHATVSRILFRRAEQQPVAYGVVFTDPMGVQHHVYLRRGGFRSKNEVILAAGTLGSPQVLMLSGVGPRPHLEKHGIRTVHEQPGVGQGVADNPMNSVFVPSPVPVALSLVQVVGVTRFGSFIEGVSGSQFGIPLRHGGRGRNFGMFSPMTGQLGTLPPRERTPEAMRRAAEVMRRLDRRAFRGGFILEKILGPLSTGHMELRSTDPHANPAVTFNYFRDPRDVERCVRGIEAIQRVARSPAFARYTYANHTTMDAAFRRAAYFPVNLLPRHPRDTRPLQQYCRDTVMTIWHYHGGCHVGAVVDRDYRVIGVRGLRVVDSSTFKYSPGTNPQATVMMLGRYMGLRILKERLLRKGTEEKH
ncbi:hypothetical protein U9M48_005875 [Paspalum notatum var. saurae]|uniref:Glucose-methanol-choline oxidoreductase N-terminal domain-containing protein n=1 Tax=Paspalum notatum var. saurae TaxID=547442 RepID=A0AAQ3PXL8_PASNO